MALNLSLQPNHPTLAYLDAPQLCYALVTLDAQGDGSGAPAINWALVADASRSMRIPIVSEAQFRQLVREGGAQEVLVDGIPVWQLTQPVPPEVKADAPSALDYTARALHSVVEQLQSSDRFTLVACAEAALVLVPSTSGVNRVALSQGIGKLKGVRLGEDTDLAQGMRFGLAELAQGRHQSSDQSDRLLLLTDGFTQNPEVCLDLARQAAAEGVAISTVGLGGEFQEDLLTALADLTGGRAVFLHRAEDIPRAVTQELAAARAVIARTVTLTLTLSAGVTLRRVTRISPALAPLEPHQVATNTYSLHLGDLQQGTPLRVLLEILAPAVSPLMASLERRPLAGQATMEIRPHSIRLAHLFLQSSNLPGLVHDLVASYATVPRAVPQAVLDAAARANAARLQQRALAAAAAGDRLGAIALLRAVAIRLTALGETWLAEAALREADALERTGYPTNFGAKELTYATRRLGSGPKPDEAIN